MRELCSIIGKMYVARNEDTRIVWRKLRGILCLQNEEYGANGVDDLKRFLRPVQALNYLIVKGGLRSNLVQFK
jgi:hypothetical protein